jgi:hypothetical protein
MRRFGWFSSDGKLQCVGTRMKNLQPSAIYHAADLELPALPIDASKPTRFMQCA